MHPPRLRVPFAALASPLASIFGSGFLVVVPVLASATGPWMPLAMLGVCTLAWLVGAVIRHNIRHVEPVLGRPDRHLVTRIDRAADLAIVLAYTVSITLYLHILSAFALSGRTLDGEASRNVLTSLIVAAIVLVGIVRGLATLDRLERWALFATLALVTLVVAGFLAYDVGAAVSAAGLVVPSADGRSFGETLALLGGMLIVVQGFETPRYLGARFGAEVRVRASRVAQLVSGAVYLVFVTAAVPLVHELGGRFPEDALVALVGFTPIPALGLAVVVAAMLSQFSAAVSDLLAAEGNVRELTRGRLSPRGAYALFGTVAIVLTWVADTFALLSLASRAFALYYLLQCLAGVAIADSAVKRAGMGALAAVLLAIVLFAAPVG